MLVLVFALLPVVSWRYQNCHRVRSHLVQQSKQVAVHIERLEVEGTSEPAFH